MNPLRHIKIVEDDRESLGLELISILYKRIYSLEHPIVPTEKHLLKPGDRIMILPLWFIPGHEFIDILAVKWMCCSHCAGKTALVLQGIAPNPASQQNTAIRASLECPEFRCPKNEFRNSGLCVISTSAVAKL